MFGKQVHWVLMYNQALPAGSFSTSSQPPVILSFGLAQHSPLQGPSVSIFFAGIPRGGDPGATSISNGLGKEQEVRQWAGQQGLRGVAEYEL